MGRILCCCGVKFRCQCLHCCSIGGIAANCELQAGQAVCRRLCSGNDKGFGIAPSGVGTIDCIKLDSCCAIDQLDAHRLTGCHRCTVQLSTHLIVPACVGTANCPVEADGSVLCSARLQNDITGVIVPGVAFDLSAAKGDSIHIDIIAAAPLGTIHAVGIDGCGGGHVHFDFFNTFHGDVQIFCNIFNCVGTVGCGNGLVIGLDDHVFAIITGKHGDREGVGIALTDGICLTGHSVHGVAIAGRQGGNIAVIAAGLGGNCNIGQDGSHAAGAAGIGIDFLACDVSGSTVAAKGAAEAAQLDTAIG